MRQQQAHHELIQILRHGGVIVYPTETAYAIGCDATNTKAIRRVYAIKSRAFTKPLPIIVSSMWMANAWVRWPRGAKKMAKQFWPGPLTLVLPKKQLPGVLTAGRRNVAVRMSSHPIPPLLARALGRPIVSTSANVSGEKACYTLQEVRKQLASRKMDGWLDGGRLRRRPPSTIVDWMQGTPTITRQGTIRI
ncbi:MAG: L-threonylcarbamoyladenylate synthase [Patescibacteria group bacterium]